MIRKYKLSNFFKDETTTTMILNVRRNVDSEKKSESQMGFEPTTPRDGWLA